jgi:ribose 5-phosphate isomerase B
MRIGIVSDHRGYELKDKIIKYLRDKNYDVVDYGTNSADSVDYVDFGLILGEKLVEGEYDFGIGICGTGIGMSIACNKVKGVRCAKIDNINEAKLAREHNDANIMAISSTKTFDEAKEIVDIFLTTAFSEEERHRRRVDKINKYEEKN